MVVLACVDGSRYTTSVCEYAARTALRLGIGVEVLHVLDRLPGGVPAPESVNPLRDEMPEAFFEEYSQVDEQRARLARMQAQAMLSQACERIRIMGVDQVEERLVYGSLVDQLGEFESRARLVVIGKRGEWEGHAILHLGSNLERVVRASQRPTLIVPPHLRPLRRFVVAYDGGSSSTKAIDMLTGDTLLLEAECHLVMVAPSEAGRRSRLEAAAARLRDAGYRVTERLEVIEPGRHDEVIISAVERTKADLLVMGAYGHSRIRNMIIGSTTTALLRASTVPVLVVR